MIVTIVIPIIIIIMIVIMIVVNIVRVKTWGKCNVYAVLAMLGCSFLGSHIAEAVPP